MRTMIEAACLFISILLFVPGGANAGEAYRDEPYTVELEAGETFKVCLSGEIVCPAIGPICDDPKVAAPVDTPEGLGFKAIGPGTTLCSAGTTFGPRRVFRIIAH